VQPDRTLKLTRYSKRCKPGLLRSLDRAVALPEHEVLGDRADVIAALHEALSRQMLSA